MTGVKGRVEFQLENSTPGYEMIGERPQEDESAAERPSETGECKSNTGQRGQLTSAIAELEDGDDDEGDEDAPLSVLADVALAPPRGDTASCSWDSEAYSFLELGFQETCIQSMRLQLQFLLSQADDLMKGQDDQERKAHAAAVPDFLFTCQPYFNYVESTAQRSLMSEHTPLRHEIYTRLLDFSEQLCDKLEQLVLTHARHSLLCLDESDPSSLSHFCIGQTQLGRLRLTAFRYCLPTPYIPHVDTGLYKRMRWNVETLPDKPQQADEKQGGESEEKAETIRETEYYFLCYEDIPNAHTYAGEESQSDVVRLWSIGGWVQVNPDPDTEDINEWITCEVPQADYHRLLFLGSKEPSSCNATELLQQLLLSQQTTL
ncbi:UPF0575 protein C19orf67 homolog [Pleuronectes platessa]|uniref:UPF0575 protein C19orf67 homolog n=1 Tax=Pleuronectes platessa TaxID=8262 RepID=UPI00232A2455|nr:UPF0575 protein C19orf67 homolog [Pleuronectes platessa]